LALVLAADVEVQPDRQRRVVAAQGGGLAGGAAGDHEAGARHHAAGVALQDAAVDAGRGTEVVRVGDQVLFHLLPFPATSAGRRERRPPSSLPPCWCHLTTRSLTYPACSSVICGYMGRLGISRHARSVSGSPPPPRTSRPW